MSDKIADLIFYKNKIKGVHIPLMKSCIFLRESYIFAIIHLNLNENR